MTGDLGLPNAGVVPEPGAAEKTAEAGFCVVGGNPAAEFTLKLHRGEGMTLIAMNWRQGTPPPNFVGFAIEYQEPGDTTFWALTNRLTFPGVDPKTDPDARSTLHSPIQKFRWIHFPWKADLPGDYVYRVTPRFMDDQDHLSSGEPQEASIQLRRETYPGELNVGFTRGFVSSQAFVDHYQAFGPISTLLPANAADGLKFKPTHPKTEEALAWMGFEARRNILDLLDEAIADRDAQVRLVAYDLNEPNVVSKLQALGSRAMVIIDDSDDHGKNGSAENQAADALTQSHCQVKRQHMGNLQHNKVIVVNGPLVKKAVCGSTNFSWRGFYVQSNNAVVVDGASAIQPFLDAFDDYWQNGTPATFGPTEPAAQYCPLGLLGVDAGATFSPHVTADAQLGHVIDDVVNHTTSSMFYSLAFLYQTPAMEKAIDTLSARDDIFVYGMSDRRAGGIHLHLPNGNVPPVYPSQLEENVPEPFKAEPTGGGGIRLHDKYMVLDFDKPTARVYLGSYNFSTASDLENGENLVLIRDRRVATAYMIDALRTFDHYEFRVWQNDPKKQVKTPLQLHRPPRPGEKAWWEAVWSDPIKIRDRLLFA